MMWMIYYPSARSPIGHFHSWIFAKIAEERNVTEKPACPQTYAVPHNRILTCCKSERESDMKRSMIGLRSSNIIRKTPQDLLIMIPLVLKSSNFLFFINLAGTLTTMIEERKETHRFGVDISTRICDQSCHVLVAVFGGPVQSSLWETTKSPQMMCSRRSFWT